MSALRVLGQILRLTGLLLKAPGAGVDWLGNAILRKTEKEKPKKEDPSDE